MLSIHLHKLLFHSYHGVHHEEKVLGGDFEVSVTVNYKPVVLPIKRLEETVNYVSIYELVKQRMGLHTELLETLATEIAQEILARFSLVEEVNISITKLHPPIISFQGAVGVSFNLKRNNNS
jgi:dihydroneopterin aldolase